MADQVQVQGSVFASKATKKNKKRARDEKFVSEPNRRRRNSRRRVDHGLKPTKGNDDMSDSEICSDSDDDIGARLRTRQSPQMLMKFIRGIAKQEAKKKAIREMGFGGFLHMDIPRNQGAFVGDLVLNFNESSSCILLKRNKEIKIEEIDLHLVYGLPMVGDAVVEGKDDEEDKNYRQCLREWREYHGLENETPKLAKIAQDLIREDAPVDDNFRRSFVVLAVNSCIKSTQNRHTSNFFTQSRMPIASDS